jgi:hypothetical protein
MSSAVGSALAPFLILLAACASTGSGDARPDAGGFADAGPFADAEPFADAGPTVDGGDVPDGQPIIDAGAADACVASWQNIAVNANFDLGSGNGWTEVPAGQLVVSAAPVTPDSGAFLGWLGGAFNANDQLYQEVAIPGDAQGLRLRGKRFIATEESPDGGPFDFWTIELRNAGGGVLLQTLGTYSNNDAAPQWLAFEHVAAATHAGQTVRLLLRGTTDDSLNTNFFIDTLAFEVLRCP